MQEASVFIVKLPFYQQKKSSFVNAKENMQNRVMFVNLTGII